MPKAFEIRQKRAKLIADARTIVDTAEKETRSLSAEEEGRYNTIMGEAETRAVEIARIEKLELIETELRSAPGRDLGDPLPHQVEKRHAYSVHKAIRQSYATRMGEGRLDGLEAEVHQEMSLRRASEGMTKARGVLVPLDLSFDPRFETRTTGLVDTTAGTGTIPTILSASMIDILRTRTCLTPLGATFMPDMQGLFAIPRQNQAATAAWAAEGSAPATSNQTADQVAFSPKTVGTFTDYTRRFMEQTNQSAEQFVRKDLTAVLARGLETGAINGSGSSNQPTGILQNSTIITNSASAQGGTNGLAPTWVQLVLMETLVANANADMGSMAYLFNSATRGKLKTTAKIGSTYPTFLWTGGATPVNDYRVVVSNLIPKNLTKGSSSGLCSAGIFGNWEDLIVAMWSGIDILVDPYTGGNAGTVRINALMDADINVRHPESFSIVSDFLTV